MLILKANIQLASEYTKFSHLNFVVYLMNNTINTNYFTKNLQIIDVVNNYW